MKLRLLTAAMATLAASALGSPAAAHPLGNFSISQYAGLHAAASTVTVEYVLDLAELPTVAEQPRLKRLGPLDACAEQLAAVELSADGRRLAMTVDDARLTFPAGQANLSTTTLRCVLTTSVDLFAVNKLRVGFTRHLDRPGLREIVATSTGLTLTGAGAGQASRTAALSAYPPDLLTKPLDMRQAEYTITAGGHTGIAAASATAPANTGGLAGRLATLAGSHDLTAGMALLAVGIAMLLGAGHAAAPGHGKTMMAAYLIGQKGRRRQALGIAATVTATHTAAVLLLGFLITVTFAIAPTALYRWLAVVNGALIAAIGIALIRKARHGHHHGNHLGGNHIAPAAEDSGGHWHGEMFHHHHSHEEGRTVGQAVVTAPRTQARPHDAGPGRKMLLAMGFAGGLSPSPSAVLVLLGAAAIGRAWFGVVLVIAYGAGMAAALTGFGMILARAGDRLHALMTGRWSSKLLPRLPLFSGVLVVAAGLGIAVAGAAGAALLTW